MCGIVGYVGTQEAAPILLDGLRRLEYRGYDSAGMAVCGPEGLQVCKTRGRLQALADLTEEGRTLTGTLGVGHTRWATHGEPNDINAHPQVSQSGLFAVVHNGIIENYALLRAQLTAKGYTFRSPPWRALTRWVSSAPRRRTGSLPPARTRRCCWATATERTSSPPT